MVNRKLVKMLEKCELNSDKFLSYSIAMEVKSAEDIAYVMDVFNAPEKLNKFLEAYNIKELNDSLHLFYFYEMGASLSLDIPQPLVSVFYDKESEDGLYRVAYNEQGLYSSTPNDTSFSFKSIDKAVTKALDLVNRYYTNLKDEVLDVLEFTEEIETICLNKDAQKGSKTLEEMTSSASIKSVAINMEKASKVKNRDGIGK